MREWYQLMLCIAFSLSFSGLYLLFKAFLRGSKRDDTAYLFSTEQQLELERTAEKKTDARVAVLIFIAVFLTAVFLVLLIEATINKGGV